LLALQCCRRIYVVAQSLHEKVVALGLPAEKIAVIQNGVDPALFQPRDQTAARRELGLSETEKILLSVGWIEPDKGVEYLLRAHTAMTERPLLVLVGEAPPGCGRFEKQMRALGIADRCRFVGAQPHQKIATWMNAADVFAFPSLHEGCPNVVLEALACGLPMVATNVGGIPEIAPRAPWCELVPPRDAGALAAALARVLAGKWDRREIACASQRTWDDVAREVHQLIVAASR
jgi:glycosyltransferase involved in cell wall biosynthesis